MKADGSGLRNLTPKPVGAYAAPAWSPDGRKLAFVSDRDGNSEVYVMNANGSGQRNLTRNPAFDADPAWSPDGRKIAFVSNRDGSYGVYVMNADGSGQRRLAQRSPANSGGLTKRGVESTGPITGARSSVPADGRALRDLEKGLMPDWLSHRQPSKGPRTSQAPRLLLSLKRT